MCKHKNSNEHPSFGIKSFLLLLGLMAMITLSQSASGSVVIGNDTSFTLNDSDGSFRLIKLESISEATVLQDSSPNGEYMWKVVATDSGGTEYDILPVSGGVKTTEYSNPSETKYNIDWTNLSINGESNVLDVKVSIRVPVDSALTYWSIDVTNRSATYGVWTVEFPKLTELGPIGDPNDDVFLDPMVLGHVTVDPSQNLPPRYIQYPGYASFQMCAFYDEASAGAYFAAYDGDGYYKHFNYDVDAGLDLVKLWMTNFPEGQGVVTTDYQMPYEVVIGTFTGDWHDAAAIYREWAVNQIWCQNGPIVTRSDIPDWYKELPMWEFITGGQSYWQRRWAEFFMGGISYADHWMYMWKDGGSEYYPDIFPPQDYPTTPPPEPNNFNDVVDRGHDAGVKFVPYLLGSLIDNRSPQYTSWGSDDYAVINSDGNKRMGGANTVWMCPDANLTAPAADANSWPVRIAEVSETIANYGVDGVYYDTTSGNCYQCFDPNHGHSIGGGNYWFTGTRRMFSRSRTTIRAVDANMIMTSENPCEAYIDVLDGFLQYTGMNPNYAPIFQAIYHDYMNLYGNSLATSKVPYSYYADDTPSSYEDYPMCLPLGLSFIQGDQLGWIAIWNVLAGELLYTPGFDPYDNFTGELAMWRKMAHFRKKAANKYLGLGQMVKPPALQGTFPNVSGDWGLWGAGIGEVNAPGILHSAWKASDGKLCVIMLNISPATIHDVSYQFDSNDYWGTTGPVDSYVLGLGTGEKPSRTAYQTFADGSVQVSKTLASLEFWALEFESPPTQRRQDAPGKIVIDDGGRTSADGDYTLTDTYAVEVVLDGSGGDNPFYGVEDGFTTFWFTANAAGSGEPNYTRDPCDFSGDYSLYMDGSVRMRIRCNDQYNQSTNPGHMGDTSQQHPYIENLWVVFHGEVGGVDKQADFAVHPNSVYGYTPFDDWVDIDANLADGLFTLSGSTYPGTSLSTGTKTTLVSGDVLEFWQNITDVRIVLEVIGNTPILENWFDIQYIELVAAAPTSCTEAVGQGYALTNDLNDDCEVNFEDFVIVAEDWLDCIVPFEAGCREPWLP